MSSNSKTLIALLLIVVLPLALLLWLAVHAMNNEQQALEHQFRGLIDKQLQAVDDTLQAYFAEQQAFLLQSSQTLSLQSDVLRSFIRRQPRIRQMLVMSGDGERLHPASAQALSAAERHFLERTQDIWLDKTILYQASGEGAQTQDRPHGWYVWHWGAETNLIFWLREGSGRLLGFELDPVRLLADLINRLPATPSPSTSAQQDADSWQIRLIDNRGSLIYQWGGFEPGEELQALAIRPLSHPLGNWKLAYFAPQLRFGGSQLRLLLTIAFLILGVLLLGLAFYLYREHTRQVRLAQQRVNFVNQVSHELKTPLTNIRMYAELLEDCLDETPLDNAGGQPQRYLNVIVNESQRLARLINNVLNFSGLQKGRLQAHRRPGSVDDVVNATAEAFRPALAQKGVNISLQLNAAKKSEIDADIVEQILNNLLSNVEKYAAGGDRVEVKTWQAGAQTFIQVHDSGPGIPKRERGRIFRPFYRISSRLTDGVAGTGIGLAIARELAHLHGGELQLVESEKGACFRVSLHTLAEEEA